MRKKINEPIHEATPEKFSGHRIYMFNVKRIAYKIRELGMRASVRIAHNKIHAYVFKHRWRKRALQKKASCLNRDVDLPINYQEPDFIAVFKHDDMQHIIKQAHEYTQHIFTFFESIKIESSIIDWHKDVRLKRQNPHADVTFDSTSFYADIAITHSSTEELKKDIKIPWQFSRFEHLITLGQAYRLTHNEHYAHTFSHHITDWLKHNPYMIGINWLCPMEVAIRAINWIWAYHYFKYASSISPHFWNTYIASLYDHMHYLENNWEIYDGKTSNHYLSNLIGYFYLSGFFNVSEKKQWCFKEFLKECDKQIFHEGTSYESTTAYHRFVTEIVEHFVLLCNEFDIPLPEDFIKKLTCMRTFISACMINDHDIIHIGDDDSGRLMAQNISPLLSRHDAESFYPEFGISIIRKKNWHISLRHHAYQNKQPSAHMHNDAMSVTLAISGIPLIIDPGSYVYTASAYWRNYFRSVKVHNTFFIKDLEPVAFDERLFAFNVPEKKLDYHACNLLSSSSDLYDRLGLRAQRILRIDKDDCFITDSWTSFNQTKQHVSCWNFTLHPDITVENKNDHWLFVYQQKPIASMRSTLLYTLESSWASLHYGTKISTLCLRAETPITLHHRYETKWSIL